MESGGADYISDITPRLKSFIRRHIQSVWQLELLLLLRSRAGPLTAAEASRFLYLGKDVLEPALKQFAAAGMAAKADTELGAFVYAPKTEQIRDSVDSLAQAYAERRVAIINAIFESPAQSFADAFKIRKDEEDS